MTTTSPRPSQGDEQRTGITSDLPTVPSYLPVLDSVRAIGAFAVVATHAGFWSGVYTRHEWVGRTIARMDVGVAIFFVLSGFLLSRPWMKAAVLGGATPGSGRYLWKRLLRIMPAYLVTAVIALAFVPENRGMGPGEWLRTLLMLDIYTRGPLPHALTQTWSLATEVAFYLVLPMLMLIIVRCLRRFGARPRVVSAAVVALIGVNIWWLLSLSEALPVESAHLNEWLPAFLSWFAVGIGLSYVEARSSQHGRLPALLESLASRPGACWAAVFGLVLLAGTSIAGPTLLMPATPTQLVTKNILYAAIAALVVIPCAFGSSESRYVRFMALPVMRHLGHVSYSVFLIHMVVLHLVMSVMSFTLFDTSFLALFSLTALGSLLAAEVLYRLVELPAMRLRNLGRRPEATTRVPTTDTITR